jgi:two-component system response regulator FlrC
MIYLDGINTEYANYFAKLLSARGLPFSLFDQEGIMLCRKEHNCFLGAVEKSSEISGNAPIVDFLKKYGFKKAVLFKLNCEKFSVNSHLNGALLEACLPTSFDIDNVELEYLAHYVIELAALGAQNFPCSDSSSENIVKLLQKISPRDVSILVNGPTGTGKEVLSQLIHHLSSRRDGPFVAINCAAIPEQMLESTLFGHEKGSFTGAVQQNVGLFRAATGGTILLDEISEMPLNLQSKLLRVIQEKKVMAVGGSSETEIDARIIATTNRDMRVEVKSGRFREDLFYRLNVFPVKTVALKDRVNDIPPIAASMLRKLDAQNDSITMLSGDAFETLSEHDWPGNVRELGNVIHRAHILSTNNTIKPEDLIFDAAEESLSTADALAAKFQTEIEKRFAS